MAKKIKTNKSEIEAIKPMESKPRYEVEEIENGFIVTKSWTDKDGRYQTAKKFHEENPLEGNEEEEED